MPLPTRGGVLSSRSGVNVNSVNIAAVPEGSWMIALLHIGDGSITASLTAGWTALTPRQATGSRTVQYFGKTKQSTDSSVSATLTGNTASSLVVIHGRGGKPVSDWVRGKIGVRSSLNVVANQSVVAGDALTSQAPALNAPRDSLVVAIFTEATSAAEPAGFSPTISGGYQAWGSIGFSTGETETQVVGYREYLSPETTTSPSVSYPNSQASNGSGMLIAIPGAGIGIPVKLPDGSSARLSLLLSGTRSNVKSLSYLRPGFNTVADMVNKPGVTWAHRGGSSNWPEMSEYAFDKAILLGYGCLEFSTSRTSDGVWVGVHDQNLNRTSLETGMPNITDMTWAQVSAYQNKLNANGITRPYLRLIDFLQKYSSKYVVVIDPKYSTDHLTELLSVLTTHGRKQATVIKFFGVGSGATAIADTASAAGFSTWGYYYEADYLSGDLNRDQGHWQLLGMDIGASAAAWAAITSYGKPVVGHIATSQAMYDQAIARGATMVQCGNVAGIKAVSSW